MVNFRIKRSIGVLECISITAAIVLGAGIFQSNDVFASTGYISVGMMMWVISGVLMILGAWSYLELGCAFPKYGGEYIFLYEAYGPLCGFLHLWTSILFIMPCSTAIKVILFAKNVIDALISPDCTDEMTLFYSYKLVATAAIFVVTYMHCISVKFTTRIQNVFMYVKLTMLALLILGGFWWMITGGVSNLKEKRLSKKESFLGYGIGLYHAVFTCADWNYLFIIAEEVKHPEISLPKALKIILPIIFISYILINPCYIAVLGIEGVAKSKALSVDFSKLALTSLKDWAMPAMLGFSNFGSLSVFVMLVSRLCIAGARNGHLPELLHQINLERFTPVPSLLFSMLLSIFVVALPADIDTIVSHNAVTNLFFIMLSVSACIVLRYKKPDLPRPIKVPLACPYIFIICNTFVIISILIANPVPSACGIAVLICGIPVYMIFITRRPATLSRGMNDFRGGPVKFREDMTSIFEVILRIFANTSRTKLTHFVQKITLTASQDIDVDNEDDEIVVLNDKQTLLLKRKSIVTRKFEQSFLQKLLE